MPQPQSIQILATLALLMMASASSAQLSISNLGSTANTNDAPEIGNALWDNTAINKTSDGVVSLQAANLPAGANMANSADDFVVPANIIWVIESVFSTGFTSGTVSPDSFGIDFYADDGGLPGALLETRTVPFGGGVNDETQELILPTSVKLDGGTYWVSVYGIYNNFIDLTTNRWNWSTGTVAINTEAAIQDTAALFGGFSWTSLSDLGVLEPSTLFALRGFAFQIDPPPRRVPTLSSWGIIAMTLALLTANTLSLRRRHH